MGDGHEENQNHEPVRYSVLPFVECFSPKPIT